MTRITLDSATVAKLATAVGPAQLCDEDGRVLGVYRPEGEGTTPMLKDLYPISDEELDRRSADREAGRPLKDILRDLRAS